MVDQQHPQLRAHADSLIDPNQFWLIRAKELITWTKEPTIGLAEAVDSARSTDRCPEWGPYFSDGELSTCYNMIDRHDPSSIAIIYESPVTNTRLEITYERLRTEVEVVAGMLRMYKAGKGDTVLIFSQYYPSKINLNY